MATKTELTVEQIELLRTQWAHLTNERQAKLIMYIIFIAAGLLFGFIFLAVSRHSDLAAQLSGICFFSTPIGIIGTIYWLPKSRLRITAQDFRSGQKLVGESKISRISFFGLRVVLTDGTIIKNSDIRTSELQIGDLLRYEKTISGKLVLACEKRPYKTSSATSDSPTLQ